MRTTRTEALDVLLGLPPLHEVGDTAIARRLEVENPILAHKAVPIGDRLRMDARYKSTIPPKKQRSRETGCEDSSML